VLTPRVMGAAGAALGALLADVKPPHPAPPAPFSCASLNVTYNHRVDNPGTFPRKPPPPRDV
jgi:hypothetical protein